MMQAMRARQLDRKNGGDVLYPISCQFTIRARQTIYLLDRNVVSLIKSVNSGKQTKDDNQKSMLEWLRSHDTRDNLFSPMTSIAEGDQKGIMDSDQFRSVILSEASSIGSFFHHARTDQRFFCEMADKLCSFQNNLNETLFVQYVKFLRTVSLKIVVKVAMSKRHSVRDFIIQAALSFGIDPSHPVVICCLSILYGSDVSRGVLKPSAALKADAWHNAISDIQIISRLGQFNSFGSDLDFHFITMDRNLKRFVESFTVTRAHASPGSLPSQTVRIQTTTNVRYDLFPDLSETQVHELHKIIVESKPR